MARLQQPLCRLQTGPMGAGREVTEGSSVEAPRRADRLPSAATRTKYQVVEYGYDDRAVRARRLERTRTELRIILPSIHHATAEASCDASGHVVVVRWRRWKVQAAKMAQKHENALSLQSEQCLYLCELCCLCPDRCLRLCRKNGSPVPWLQPQCKTRKTNVLCACRRFAGQQRQNCDKKWPTARAERQEELEARGWRQVLEMVVRRRRLVVRAWRPRRVVHLGTGRTVTEGTPVGDARRTECRRPTAARHWFVGPCPTRRVAEQHSVAMRGWD